MDSVSTVFVDRDGVINRKAPANGYVLSVADLVLLPGTREALASLTRSGKCVIVITNQRAVAKGLLTRQRLARIHAALVDQLQSCGARVDGVYACVHDVGLCSCRKPLPGLLLRAQRQHSEIEFQRSVVIGDSAADICAGAAVGCRTILVGRGRRRAAELAALQILGRRPTATALSLLDATKRHVLTW